MSLPDEQIRAQSRAWELMTGPAKGWTRKNFHAATRHFVHPAQLQAMMERDEKWDAAQARELTPEKAIAETIERTMGPFEDDGPIAAQFLPAGYAGEVKGCKLTVRKAK